MLPWLQCEMNADKPKPEDFARIRTLFDAAIDKPASARAAYLDAACADRPDLIDEVLALLHTATAGVAIDLQAEQAISAGAADLIVSTRPHCQTELATTRSSTGLVKAAWAWCSKPKIHDSGGGLPSRCCQLPLRTTTLPWRDCASRHAPWRR